jgi:WhiB family redox-sensing transcriptional regulator
MNQGLRRRITLPVVSRAGSLGPDATAARVTGRIWPLEGWRNSASCRESDPDLFYPLGRGRAALEQAEVAKAICRACPSREPCLTYALVTRQDLGVWGGTSPDDRRERIRGRRPAVAS